MAERYIFFNSAPGDPRTYQAADFAYYFGSVLSTGLLHTDNVPGMEVSVVAGTLTTRVSAGKAIMKGHLYENTADLTLTHSLPEATQDRIDRIVLRLDLRNAERNIKLHVKQGVASASPVAPTLQRDNVIHEISLGRVLVRKNTVQLLASDLLDERLNDAVAGLVYSLISIPTSQFQAQWDEFMAGIEDSGFASVESVTAVSDALTTHNADDTSHVRYGIASGINTKTIALNPAPTSLVEGFALSFKNVTANNVAVTLNVNGLGAKPIIKSNGNALASGNLKAGSIYTVRYDGTSFILQGEGGEYGTAVAGDVLTGKTIGTENGVVSGTLLPGKKYAEGSLTIPGNFIVAISNLTFRPSFISIEFLITGSNNMVRKTYSSTGNIKVNSRDFILDVNSNAVSGVDTGDWTITSTGFSTKLLGGGYPATWRAFE